MVDPEYIRSLIRGNPFRRFTVVMSDGRRVEVRRISSVLMTPDGQMLRFADAPSPVRTKDVKEVLVEPELSDETVQRVEMIRELRNAAPFVPFSIIVDDGRKLMVGRSFQIGIAPSRREIMYANSPIDFQFIPSSRVKEILRDGR